MPDSIEIKVDGRDRVANWLRGLTHRLPKATADETEAWAKETRADLKAMPYPAAPAGSRYKRTGQLANRWAVEKRGGGVFAITNRAQDRRGRFYAAYVVGDAAGKSQAWMHRGRWWRFAEVIKDRLGHLRRRLAERLNREAR
jgi:hypothetical protein